MRDAHLETLRRRTARVSARPRDRVTPDRRDKRGRRNAMAADRGGRTTRTTIILKPERRRTSRFASAARPWRRRRRRSKRSMGSQRSERTRLNRSHKLVASKECLKRAAFFSLSRVPSAAERKPRVSTTTKNGIILRSSSRRGKLAGLLAGLNCARNRRLIDTPMWPQSARPHIAVKAFVLSAAACGRSSSRSGILLGHSAAG